MKCLVLGGTGFIGSHVVRELVRRGHEVSVFHRGTKPADLPPEVMRIHGDRKRLADSALEFKRLRPDVVIDMVAYTEAEAAELVNVFRGVAGRLVVISSMDVYASYGRLKRLESGEADRRPSKEDAPLRQVLYPYRAQAKSEDELFYNYEKILVERAGSSVPELPATILRLPAVYGPGDPYHRLFEYLKRMDDSRPVILLDERKAGWRWGRGYVENVGAAVALAATDAKSAGQTYNVGERVARTEAEWVRDIRWAAGWNGDVIALPQDGLPAHLRTPHDWRHDVVGDTEKIHQELGFDDPVPLDEAMRRTVAWERAGSPEPVDHKLFDYVAEDECVARQERAAGSR